MKDYKKGPWTFIYDNVKYFSSVQFNYFSVILEYLTSVYGVMNCNIRWIT